MRRIVFLGLLACAPAWTELVPLTLEEVVRDSDLAVVGVLDEVGDVDKSEEGTTARGNIVIRKVLYGRVAGEVGRRPTEIYQACECLAAAGPAAVLPARRLMSHAQEVQRAWGCELAGLSCQEALVPDLAALLSEGAEMVYVFG